MSNSTKQIITYGTNSSQEAITSVTSRSSYECANAKITRGVTLAPNSIEDCLNSFPDVKKIADAIGFTTGNLNLNDSVCPEGLSGSSGPFNLLLENSSLECREVYASSDLGEEWLGCIWGTPNAPYSCVCPDVKSKYEAYIKFRLNDAAFWNTPVETPVKRAEFMDAFKYASKITATIAGDFLLKVGTLVYVRLTAVNKFGIASTESYLNGYYYITGLKHVVTNSGTHETALFLSSIAPRDQVSIEDGYPYS
jgi:hypothetical protein